MVGKACHVPVLLPEEREKREGMPAVPVDGRGGEERRERRRVLYKEMAWTGSPR